MQLAGANAFGPPRDRAAAIAVLRAAVDAGVDHIDTSENLGAAALDLPEAARARLDAIG